MDIIERTRRYHRLLQLAHSPDEPMLTWMWWSAKSWATYIFALRWLEKEQ